MKRTYAAMPGYAFPILDDKVMQQWRIGRAAANPAEAQALVREIDELRDTVQTLRGAVIETKPTPMTFVDLAAHGLVVNDEIDDYVDRWHRLEGGGHPSLFTFLGLTDEQGEAWVKEPHTINDVVGLKQVELGLPVEPPPDYRAVERTFAARVAAALRGGRHFKGRSSGSIAALNEAMVLSASVGWIYQVGDTDNKGKSWRWPGPREYRITPAFVDLVLANYPKADRDTLTTRVGATYAANTFSSGGGGNNAVPINKKDRHRKKAATTEVAVENPE